MTTGVKGTFQYMAPELMGKWNRDGIDLFACDMWSLGVTIYQAVYYRLPFDIAT